MQQNIESVREDLWSATAMLNDFVIANYEYTDEIMPIVKTIESCRKALKRVAV